MVREGLLRLQDPPHVRRILLPARPRDPVLHGYRDVHVARVVAVEDLNLAPRLCLLPRVGIGEAELRATAGCCAGALAVRRRCDGAWDERLLTVGDVRPAWGGGRLCAGDFDYAEVVHCIVFALILKSMSDVQLKVNASLR